MEVLLSKEHDCFQIYIYILMKSSAYPSLNLDPASFYELSKILGPYK